MEATRKPASEMTPRELGSAGEGICARFLERHGFEVLERNWRCHVGEVDVVAVSPEGDRVLVEVKTRLALGAGDLVPELAVDAGKLARYRRLARVYLADHADVEAVRFDVAGVSMVGERQAHIRYYEGVDIGELAGDVA